MYQVDKEYQPPLLPMTPPPRGLSFFWGTWSGRIIVLNSIFFVLLSLDAGSFFNPSGEALIRWGAKDNSLIVGGEFWRLLSPIFLHVGLIHFAFNNYALYALAYQVEALIGSRWFLALYLLSGIGGNIASSLFSLGLSAGASSSLFGILGAGFYIERLVGRKYREVLGKKPKATSTFSGLLVANLILGFMIPQIDNAAHMGGLLSGVSLVYALMKIRPNRLVVPDAAKAKQALLALCLCLICGALLAGSRDFLAYRLTAAGQSANDPRIQFRYLTENLKLKPNDLEARLLRLELSLRYGNYSTAKEDFDFLKLDSLSDEGIKRVESKLAREGELKAVSMLQHLRQVHGSEM